MPACNEGACNYFFVILHDFYSTPLRRFGKHQLHSICVILTEFSFWVLFICQMSKYHSVFNFANTRCLPPRSIPVNFTNSKFNQNVVISQWIWNLPQWSPEQDPKFFYGISLAETRTGEGSDYSKEHRISSRWTWKKVIAQAGLTGESGDLWVVYCVYFKTGPTAYLRNHFW